MNFHSFHNHRVTRTERLETGSFHDAQADGFEAGPSPGPVVPQQMLLCSIFRMFHCIESIQSIANRNGVNTIIS